MDNTDCWISEFDFRSLTAVPSSSNFALSGSSSGYCSSEESHGQFKAVGGSHDSKSLVCQQRQSESFRHADAFSGSSGVELAGVGTGSDLIAMEDCTFDFGTSPQNFDDLMDTFWNPMDSLVDFDMADVSQPSIILGVAGNNANPGLATLASTTTAAGRELPSAKHGWQKRAASPSKEGPSLVKKPSNPSIAGGKTISAESQNRLKRVFDFQQQVAGLADMTVGDEEEYILQFSVGNGDRAANHVAESTTTSATQGSALLGGVFSHRGPVPASLKNCETKALARVRGGAVASSCGALLRHSVSIPSGMKPAAGGGAREGMQRSAGGRSQNSGAAHPTCARGDMKGGRLNALAFALEDHRYTLKPLHNNPPVTRGSRGRKSGAAPSSSAQSAAAPCSGGKMSILEAFLRSTRPLDPNKGSNAALAAEGLAHLRLETGDSDVCRSSSGTILKKLLTGEIDQNEVHRCEQEVILERGKSGSASSAIAPAEPILADDFEIGAELLLGQSGGNDLLGADLGNGPLWMNAENDEALSSELDEILREQTRQDNLWLRKYIDCL